MGISRIASAVLLTSTLSVALSAQSPLNSQSSAYEAALAKQDTLSAFVNDIKDVIVFVQETVKTSGVAILTAENMKKESELTEFKALLNKINDTTYDSALMSNLTYKDGRDNVEFKIVDNSGKAKLQVKVKDVNSSNFYDLTSSVASGQDSTFNDIFSNTNSTKFDTLEENAIDSVNSAFNKSLQGAVDDTRKKYALAIGGLQATNYSAIDNKDTGFVANENLSQLLSGYLDSYKDLANSAGDAILGAIDASGDSVTGALKAANDALVALVDAGVIENLSNIADGVSIFDSTTGKIDNDISSSNLTDNKAELTKVANALKSKADDATLGKMAEVKQAKDSVATLLLSGVITQKLKDDLETKKSELQTLKQAQSTLKNSENTALSAFNESKSKVEKTLSSVDTQKIPGLSGASLEQVSALKTKLGELKTKLEAVESDNSKKAAVLLEATQLDFTVNVADSGSSEEVGKSEGEAKFNSTSGTLISDSTKLSNGITSLTTLLTDALAEIAKITDDITNYTQAKTKLTDAKSALSTNETNQKNLASAIEAILPVLENGMKITIDANLQNNAQELEQFSEILTNGAFILSKAVIDGASNNTLKQTLEEITKNSNALQSAVFEALLDVASKENATLKTVLENADAGGINSFYKDISSSSKQSADLLTSNTSLNALNLASTAATSTRLAKLANPFNSELALASAINELENDKFADLGNGLSEIVKRYTDRFNYDSSVWASVIGAKNIAKNQPNTDLYGFSVGYDKAFDNAIVGIYGAFANANTSGDNVSLKSNNYEVGLYARAYIDQSEIDTKLSTGFAKSKLQRSTTKVVPTQQNANINSKSFGASVGYGYVIDLSNEFFIKPLVGLEYTYSQNGGYKESGDLAISAGRTNSKVLEAKAGLELRKYVENGNFVYATPAVITQVYKSATDTFVKFANSNRAVGIAADEKKQTFFAFNAGADMKLSNNLSTNFELGAKLGDKSKQVSATVGLKYKF